MEDLIKREDAIKAISISCGTCLARGTEDCDKCSVPKLCELISAIPSADRPQVNPDLVKNFLKRQYEAVLEENKMLKEDRPGGEWIIEYHGNGWNDFWDYTCPICGKKYERADDVLQAANFCPHCGAMILVKTNGKSRDSHEKGTDNE